MSQPPARDQGFTYIGPEVPLAVDEYPGVGFTYMGEKPPIPAVHPENISYEDAVRAWSSLGWGQRMQDLGVTEGSRAANIVQQSWVPGEIGSMAWGQGMQDIGLSNAMIAQQIFDRSWVPTWEWEPWMVTPPAMSEEVALQNRIGAESIGISPILLS